MLTSDIKVLAKKWRGFQMCSLVHHFEVFIFQLVPFFVWYNVFNNSFPQLKAVLFYLVKFFKSNSVLHLVGKREVRHPASAFYRPPVSQGPPPPIHPPVFLQFPGCVLPCVDLAAHIAAAHRRGGGIPSAPGAGTNAAADPRRPSTARCACRHCRPKKPT